MAEICKYDECKKNTKSGAEQNNSGDGDVSTLDRKEIMVQSLATEATGKAKSMNEQVLKSLSNSHR